MTLPPGRLRLATKPSLTGSLAVVNTMGIVAVAALAEMVAQRLPPVSKTATWTVDQFYRHRRQLLVMACCPAVFDLDVLPVDKAFIFETQADSFCEMRITFGGLPV